MSREVKAFGTARAATVFGECVWRPLFPGACRTASFPWMGRVSPWRRRPNGTRGAGALGDSGPSCPSRVRFVTGGRPAPGHGEAGGGAAGGGLPVDPGLCAGCRYAAVKDTRRGTTYLRCTRAAWDGRLARYPRLPVVTCVGFVPEAEGE